MSAKQKIIYNGEEHYFYYDVYTRSTVVEYPNGTKKNLTEDEVDDFLLAAGQPFFYHKKQ